VIYILILSLIGSHHTVLAPYVSICRARDAVSSKFFLFFFLFFSSTIHYYLFIQFLLTTSPRHPTSATAGLENASRAPCKIFFLFFFPTIHYCLFIVASPRHCVTVRVTYITTAGLETASRAEYHHVTAARWAQAS
jgi:hypothetical protein